jgi:hypothetical protein
LFDDAIDGLTRAVEYLEHLDLVYQGKRFAGTYVFMGRWVFPRRSYSEQEWKEKCEQYGQDPEVERFYVDGLPSKHPLGASPYPPRDLVALIAAYALSDRPIEPLLELVNPKHAQEDLEEVKKLFYETKAQGGRRDGLRRTAQQFAAADRRHRLSGGGGRDGGRGGSRRAVGGGGRRRCRGLALRGRVGRPRLTRRPLATAAKRAGAPTVRE